VSRKAPEAIQHEADKRYGNEANQKNGHVAPHFKSSVRDPSQRILSGQHLMSCWVRPSTGARVRDDRAATRAGLLPQRRRAAPPSARWTWWATIPV